MNIKLEITVQQLEVLRAALANRNAEIMRGPVSEQIDEQYVNFDMWCLLTKKYDEVKGTQK